MNMSIGTRASADIRIFGEIRWGSHLCHLYQSNDELIDLAVPYFREGLERNALCIWLSSGTLEQQVMEALRDGYTHFDRCQEKGQILAVPHAEWYLRDGRLDISTAIKHGSDALIRAKALGFDGIWVAGELSWVDQRQWSTVVAYEEAVFQSISTAAAVALCGYPIRSLGVPEALDLFRIHQFIVMQREDRWKVIESLEQTKSEKALRDTERSYQHLFDTTLDGIEVVDAATGRVLVANQAAANIFGFATPEEMVGLDPLEYIPAGDRERVAGLMAEAMFERDLHQIMELRALRTDGSEVWISAVGVRTQYQGKLAGIISIRDITVQKRAERALDETQRDLQAVFDSVREGIAVFDLTGRLLRVNRRILEVGGYSPDELIGKSFDQLFMFGSDDITRMASVFAPVLAGLDSPPLELEVETKFGDKLVLEARVSPLKKIDEVIGSIAVIRDITDRKHAEEALKESEQRYRLLAENVTDVIWVTDVNLRPTYVSPSIERMLGYGAHESLFRGLEEALDPSSAHKVRDIVARLTATEKTEERGSAELNHPVELGLRRRDGSTLWVDTTVTVMRDPDGRPVQFLGVLRDVTERKRAEEQVQQGYQKLEQALEGTIQAIRTMVDARDRYTAGHQLRVTELACAIAEAMGLPKDRVHAVHVAGLLHDVGKMLLPTELLTKPGRLNDIEFAMVRTHAKAGYNILKSIDFPWPIAKTVLQHHERMDGSGYPDGVRGEEILMEARILAVADVVEAMSSHRPYRPALGLDQALDEVVKNSGVLYDPRVVDACVRVFREDSFSFKGEATADLY
jgi:PAS domain S-box-containing protein/putative nucleotidyltransferase with HDIG domain